MRGKRRSGAVPWSLGAGSQRRIETAGRIQLLLLLAILVLPVPVRGQMSMLRTRELWRRGGENDTVLFGVVAAITSDRNGDIHVLDSQLSTVSTFSPTGEFLGEPVHEGEGPGEVRYATDILCLPDGTLGVIQQFPGRMIRVQPDGTPAPNHPFGQDGGGFAILLRGASNGEYLILGGINIGYSASGTSAQEYFISRWDMAGVEGARIFTKHTETDYNDLVLDEAALDLPLDRFAIGRDGSVYIAPARDRYEIEIHSPDGTMTQSITRAVTAPRRNAAQLDRARQRLEGQARYYPSPPSAIKIQDTRAIITGLFARRDGRLFVATNIPPGEFPAGVGQIFDVFEADGVYAGQVGLICPINPEHDLLYLQNERLLVVTGGRDAALAAAGGATDGDADTATLELICYSLDDSSTN
ncbi:MAG: hypothetical protein GY835_10655 [bacterium]|nr:hypothetical protein [bacterium]